MALSIQSIAISPVRRAGRPPGALNAINSDVRDMILRALNKAGGERYLARQADENPSAFLSLLGRILPKEVIQEGGSPVHLHLVAAQLVQAVEAVKPQQQPAQLTIEGDLPTE